MPVYRGGVLRKYNRAILRTRRSENRSVEIYNEHCRDIIKAWESIVGKDGESGLRTVWVLGALTTAVEAGFERPTVRLLLRPPDGRILTQDQAGSEISWLREHKDEFQRLADEGDEDFVGLMHEIETREDFAEARTS
jgi:hypothetical protein